MNGRVYNPTLARFVSADPLISNPDDTQNYNRYSYVHNRPMFYTDPSGFETDDATEEEEVPINEDSNTSIDTEIIEVTGKRTYFPSNELKGEEAQELIQQIAQMQDDFDGGTHNSITDAVIRAGVENKLTLYVQNNIGKTGTHRGREKFKSGFKDLKSKEIKKILVSQISRAECGGRPCVSRSKGKTKGWFIQAGIIGSGGASTKGGGDFGVFIGQTDDGVFKAGFYETATASLSTSAGGDLGFIIGLSDSSVNNLKGSTIGVNGGLDSPVVDIYTGVETFQNGSGGVFNIMVTFGFDVSAVPLAGAETTVNHTFMQPMFESDNYN